MSKLLGITALFLSCFLILPSLKIFCHYNLNTGKIYYLNLLQYDLLHFQANGQNTNNSKYVNEENTLYNIIAD